MTLIAVEFIASTSSFLGGAPGTGNQKKKGEGEKGRKAECQSKTEREKQCEREIEERVKICRVSDFCDGEPK